MTKTEKEILEFLEELSNKYVDEYYRNRFWTDRMAAYSEGKVRATDDIMNGINEIIDNNEQTNDL